MLFKGESFRGGLLVDHARESRGVSLCWQPLKWNQQSLKLNKRLFCVLVDFYESHFVVSFCLCGHLLFGCWKREGNRDFPAGWG